MCTHPSPTTRTFTFQHCWVHVSPGYTETVFHDGASVTAAPERSEAYRARARALGYGEDTEALSREHELLHTLLMEAAGFGTSPTLWAVAHGQQGGVAPVWAQEEEETLVLAFQVYLNGGEASPEVCALGGLGLDIDILRREALQRLRSE